MENADPNLTGVQRVTKSSSDQLLRKFAEVGSDSNDRIAAKELRLAKRVKRTAKKECGDHGYANSNSKSYSNSLVERKSLLPRAASRKPVALIRRMGMGRPKIRAGEIKNKAIINFIEKTWRRTVEGASRILMEKHYNRHKRLINDPY